MPIWVGRARRAGSRLSFYLLRPLAAVLPRAALAALCGPPAAAAALLDLACDRPRFADLGRLPPAVRPPGGRARRAWAVWRQRTRFHHALLIGLWTDRLGRPGWRGMCRVDGPAAGLLASGTRPVVLAAVHAGPIDMLYCWLRSAGVPVVLLTNSAAGRPARTKYLDRLADGRPGFARLPITLEPDELRPAVRHLRAGGVLVVVVDGGVGNRVRVTAGGVSLDLSPGLFRLAGLGGAAVVPCRVAGRAGGRATITLGDPIPDEVVRDPARHPDGLAAVFGFHLPGLRDAPGQMYPYLVGELARANAPAGPRAGDPADPAARGGPLTPPGKSRARV
jgi:hypothetical protein